MNNLELAEKAKWVASNLKTLYILGCFGAPMNASNKKRYTSNYDYNKQADRKKMIENASADTFGFDCVCLIKGLLWGFNGDASKTYGGAIYKSNGVPDIGANQIINVCTEVSADFTKIEIGELCWMEGHVGIYVGDGLSVECTPKWTNNVQFTACNRTIAGRNKRTWTKHGKLPYVEYVTATPELPEVPSISNDLKDYLQWLDSAYQVGVYNSTDMAATIITSSIKALQKALNSLYATKLAISGIFNYEDYLEVKAHLIKKGDKSNLVYIMQGLLVQHGFSVGPSGIDGSFGADTNKALQQFQSAHNLPIKEQCDVDCLMALLDTTLEVVLGEPNYQTVTDVCLREAPLMANPLS